MSPLTWRHSKTRHMRLATYFMMLSLATAAASNAAVFGNDKAHRLLMSPARTAAATYPEPDEIEGPSRMMGDLDGPDGQLWYYTATFINKVKEYEYFKENLLREYIFDIYDSEMNFVGRIHDKVRYEGDEWRVPSCEILPIITRNFFNSDEKYEVAVGMAINKGTPGHMRDCTYVYSIGGEKETLSVEDVKTGEMVDKEFDKPVYRIDSLIGDVLDLSTPGNEEYYFTIYGEWHPDDEKKPATRANSMTQEEKDAEWERRTSAKMTLSILGKADGQGKLQNVFSFSTPLLCMPGDQESTPYLISINHEGIGYYAVSRYKEPFWNPYYSMEDDLTMRESNSLMVDVYKVKDCKADKIQTTEIPFVKDSGQDILATYMSIGDFNYRRDINFGDFTQDGLASFYVTKNNYHVGESHSYSYYVYDPTGGRPLLTLFKEADTATTLTDIPGHEPQAMFVERIGSSYLYNFVDLISGKQKAEVNCRLELDEEGDYDIITANIDRAATGDSYMYAGELRSLALGDDDENFMRVAWLSPSGTLSRIDEINIGNSVMYAQCNITGEALQPDLFNSDPWHEYMVLVKRAGDDGKLSEELVIGQAVNPQQPSGRTLLLAKANERGALRTITLYPHEDKPALILWRSGNGGFYMDKYFLPLEKYDSSGITAAGSDTQHDIDAPIYNLHGIQVGTDPSHLPAGIYIHNGKKFLIRR